MEGTNAPDVGAGYFAYPSAAIDAPLDVFGVATVVYLWRVADVNGFSICTVRGICDELRHPPATVISSVARLIGLGMVEVRNLPEGCGGEGARLYRVLPPPWAWQGPSPDASWSAARLAGYWLGK